MIGGVKTEAPAQVRPTYLRWSILRSLMFSSMGSDVGGEDAAWRLAHG